MYKNINSYPANRIEWIEYPKSICRAKSEYVFAFTDNYKSLQHTTHIIQLILCRRSKLRFNKYPLVTTIKRVDVLEWCAREFRGEAAV